MATSELRPRRIGEILDAGIKLCLRHWRVFALCVVVFVVPLEILNVLVQASIDPDQLRLASDSTSGADANDVALGGRAVLNFLSGLILAVSTMACFQAVSDALLGTEPAAGRSLRAGLRRLLPYVGLSVVLTFALLVAFVALVIPGIWLAVAWSLAGAVLVLEREGPFQAIRRSWGLVRGGWWATFGTFLVAGLLVLVIILVVGLALGVLVGAVIGDSEVTGAIALVIIDTVAYALAIPYFAAVTVLIYYDRRVRKEGLDLRMRVEEAGEPAPPPEPVPSGGWAYPSAPAGEPQPAEPRAAEPPAGEPEPPAAVAAEPPAADAPADTESPGEAEEAARPPDRDRADPESPGEDDQAERSPDRNRADWLPPEAPRGPGGL